MEAGSVTYHNTKLCRYGRCHKDRERIKALEKTKSTDRTDIDLYQEMKNNERALIERRKQHSKHVALTGAPLQDDIFDPIEADRQAMAHKETRQGDEQSGLDQGMAALESLALGDGGLKVTAAAYSSSDPSSKSKRNDEDTEDTPIWHQQSTKDEQDYNNNETAIFLLERGYPRSSVDKVKEKKNLQALQQLWSELGDYSTASQEVDADELMSAREEEREVLDAIFGEDIEWFMDPESNSQDTTILDASVPITTYEPPQRYFMGSEPPPELRLEIYLANSHYPFCHSPPLLALVGGGIPQEYLLKMTQQLYQEAILKATEEEPGDPQLFTLITHVGEIWEAVVEEEGIAAAKAEEEARQARLKAIREQQAEMSLEAGADDPTTASSAHQGAGIPNFTSEQERRAYAASIIAKSRHGVQVTTTSSSTKVDDTVAATAKQGKKYYNTGVSDASLVEDLFS